MKIQPKVVEVLQLGSPAYVQVTAEYRSEAQQARRTFRQVILVHQSDWPEEHWPIKPGDILFIDIEASARPMAKPGTEPAQDETAA